MNNKFFTFIKPYLNIIDNGLFFRKSFYWLYIILAVLNLVLPLYILYKAVDNHIFEFPAKFVTLFVVVWLIIAFVSWVSFQLWWNRKERVALSSELNDEFTATPVFSHLVQTAGEWLGTWIGVVGFLTTLLATIILGDEGSQFSRLIGIDFLSVGIPAIIITPIIGFLIIVIARFFAEQIKTLSAIANNTKRN
jgi:hypothetical protein